MTGDTEENSNERKKQTKIDSISKSQKIDIFELSDGLAKFLVRFRVHS